jgi:methyl-accepting chemotaxis protein
LGCAQSRPVPDAEFKRIAKGWHEVWIEASYNPVLDGNGKPVVVVKFATDITQKMLRSLADASKIAPIDRAQACYRVQARRDHP